MNILHIDSATTGAASVSRALTAKIVEKLQSDNPGANVVYRDLGTEPLAHLNPVLTGAIRFPEEDQTDDMKAAAGPERKVLDEFLAADVVVIGAPMYNSRSLRTSSRGSTGLAFRASPSAMARTASKGLPADAA